MTTLLGLFPCSLVKRKGKKEREKGRKEKRERKEGKKGPK
jgi:hypothetical protein